MDVKISLAVSLALNQILTGEPDTSFPDELRSTLRWTSPAGRQTERNYRLPNATGYKTRRLNIATYIKDESRRRREVPYRRNNKDCRKRVGKPQFKPMIRIFIRKLLERLPYISRLRKLPRETGEYPPGHYRVRFILHPTQGTSYDEL